MNAFAMRTEMPPSSVKRPPKWTAGTSRIAAHARQVADASDRWFLALTGGILQAGDWAKREVFIVADSAVAAFATTVDVGRKLSAVESSGVDERARRRR